MPNEVVDVASRLTMLQGDIMHLQVWARSMRKLGKPASVEDLELLEDHLVEAGFLAGYAANDLLHLVAQHRAAIAAANNDLAEARAAISRCMTALRIVSNRSADGAAQTPAMSAAGAWSGNVVALPVAFREPHGEPQGGPA
jgi:hypothetical protein